jgi:hypothetical protein
MLRRTTRNTNQSVHQHPVDPSRRQRWPARRHVDEADARVGVERDASGDPAGTARQAVASLISRV